MRWISAGVSRERRSTRSVEKSTSSTVHVFFIPSLNISKNTGYRIGRSVRDKPGSRMELGAFVDMIIFRLYWQASQDLGLSSEQLTFALALACRSTRLPTATVVFAILVAGRDRR